MLAITFSTEALLSGQHLKDLQGHLLGAYQPVVQKHVLSKGGLHAAGTTSVVLQFIRLVKVSCPQSLKAINILSPLGLHLFMYILLSIYSILPLWILLAKSPR